MTKTPYTNRKKPKWQHKNATQIFYTTIATYLGRSAGVATAPNLNLFTGAKNFPRTEKLYYYQKDRHIKICKYSSL